MTTKTSVEFIADDLSRGKQSWRRQATVKAAGHKIRVTVDRDSYDFQSRIYSEVFSPAELKWNTLQSLSGKDHGHLPSAYTRDDDAGTREIRMATNQLVNDLVDYAIEVLS